MNTLKNKELISDNEFQTTFSQLPRKKQNELIGLTSDKKENNTKLVKLILYLSQKDVQLRVLAYTGAIIMLIHTYLLYSSHNPIGSMLLVLFATGILLLDIYAVLYIIAIVYFNITKKQDLGFTN